MNAAKIPFMEPLHILGSGAIGLFWASSIRSAFPSYPLAVMFRSHHKETLGSLTNEIDVCSMQNGRPSMASVPIQFIGDEKKSPIKNLILATKAHQATNAVESIIQRLSSFRPRIMVLSNGAIDVREKILEVLRKYDIQEPELIMCMTINSVVQDPPDEDMFHLTNLGIVRSFIGGSPEVAQLWDQSGLNATSIESVDMEILLWKKLAGNCFCNPLTALLGVTNGDLLHNSQSISIRSQLIREVAAVAQAINPGLQEELSEVALDDFLQSLIKDNLNNKSSMYHDIQNGRRTEVDNLNGYVARKGEELGIQTPCNQELLEKIREFSTKTTSALDRER